MWSTDDCVANAFFFYHSDENSKRKSFAESRGEVAKRTANYTKQFAEIFWRQLYRKANLGAVAVNRDDVMNACQGFRSPSGKVFGDGHREIDSRPQMPMWRSLVTRVVKPKSADARCEGAANAIQKEVANMQKKGRLVWDTEEIYYLIDILRNPEIPEAMFGRVFSIL